ncbi:MAG: hypothetical protein OEZ18_06150 [Candidatus Bathyarchaeota archaeon]|nr:hypothetical protein [Candidatus Bathyarchaeota archaeon]MDH5794123.1 hypothetical protein [Candidatus Bathyarchaeota archaeon]
MQRNFDSDLGKWLLCKLMVKQGYSEADVAKHMKKKETLTTQRRLETQQSISRILHELLHTKYPNLDEDRIKDMEASAVAKIGISSERKL